ncbi:MAG: hypothetical protein HY744_06395 [Deltaproteobacteria bacterium]|nr:hypothetical protein [Deltaproteobacteria bacterium]
METKRMAVPALAVVATLALGCNLVTGIDEFEFSPAVGDWKSKQPTLGYYHTMTLLGDGTGSARFALDIDPDKDVQMAEVAFRLVWKESSGKYALDATCDDAACGGWALAVDAECRSAADGDELHCVIEKGSNHEAPVDFARVDEEG